MIGEIEFKKEWENLAAAYGKSVNDTSAMGKLCLRMLNDREIEIKAVKEAFNKIIGGESELHREKRFFPKVPEIVQECLRAGNYKVSHDWINELPHCHRCYFCSFWLDGLIRCKFKIAEQDRDKPEVFTEPKLSCDKFIHIFDYAEQLHYQSYWNQVAPNFADLRRVLNEKASVLKKL